MRKILIILLVFSVFFSACSANQEATSKENNNAKQTSKQNIKLVVKPYKTKYIQSNGITIDSLEKKISTSKGKATLYLLQIHGLKNKDIESKINKDIEESINNNIQNYVEGSNEKPDSFYTAPELNANNLVSISLYSDYSGFREGLLYRLSDGKRIFLKDLFTEGTDYVSFLNRKIIEKILLGYGDESEFLREPFSTIAPDQSFSISVSNLNIIFHKDQSGFAVDYVISIPLVEIDDYVDLLDKQKDPGKEIYENTRNIVKHNNIFVTETQEPVQEKNGNFNLRFPVISGMRNPVMEKRVDKFIRDSLNEVKESYPTASGERYVDIEMYSSFNCYDYLCIVWQGFSDPSQAGPWPLQLKAYTIDLKTGKLVNPKEMLNNYANNNEAFKAAFTKKILSDLRYYAGNMNIDNIEKHGTDSAYSFLVNNSTIYFLEYGSSDEPKIAVYFRENLISTTPISVEASFVTDLNTPPELFFK